MTGLGLGRDVETGAWPLLEVVTGSIGFMPALPGFFAGMLVMTVSLRLLR
jgi:hypothetical protein